MKFHLPKKLMVAVLAAISASTVQAATLYPNEVLNIEEGATVTWEDYSKMQNGDARSPLVKDGDGTLTLKNLKGSTKEGEYYKGPLVAREGKIDVIDSTLRAHGVGTTGTTSAYTSTWIMVGGKDAEMTFTNSKFTWGGESHMNVGTCDGSGTLNITKQSSVSTASLFAGMHDFSGNEREWGLGWYFNGNGTAATDDIPTEEQEPYEITHRYTGGTYVDGYNGYNEKFGHAEINVKEGSALTVGTALILGHASLNISGEDSIVNTQKSYGGTANFYSATWGIVMGNWAGSDSTIKITDGGKLFSYGGLFSEYDAANSHTRATVIVDGKSENGVSSTMHIKGFAHFGRYQTEGSKTAVTVSRGGYLHVESGTRLGMEGGYNDVSITVDSKSKFETKGITFNNKGVIVDNGGEIIATDVVMLGGSLNLNGEAASLSANNLTVNSGATIRFSDTATEVPCITLTGSLSINSGAIVELGIADTYNGEEITVAIATVGKDNVTIAEDAILDVDSLLWSTETLTWDIQEDATYITGKLTKKEVVNLNGEEVTLEEGEVLGGGTPVINTGTGSITTEDGETAVLPDAAIENEGTLTIGGSYDGKELEIFETPDTRVCVDGVEGNNGYYREGGSAILVVDNNDGAGTLIVEDGTTVKSEDGESLRLYASGLATGELDYSEYHIVDTDHAPSIGKIQDMRPETEDGKTLTIDMTGGALLVKEDEKLSADTQVKTTGGAIKTEGAVTVGGDQYQIGGNTSVVVDGESEAIITGENDYAGNTVISGDKAKLTVETDTALGKSTVYLQEHGTLDLNSQAVGNDIYVEGCTICNADKYNGNVTVTGDLELDDAANGNGTATANKVTFEEAGNIKSSYATLIVNSVEMASGATGEINSDLTTNEGGTIILNNGSQLKVNGALTLGKGTTFVLKGNGYAAGSELGYGDPTADSITTGSATLTNGRGTYAIEDGVIYLTAVFDNSIAEALTVTNWGIATASRTFVNAVRGQRTNTGCIADGRGTAWAAVLGGTSDIGSGDVDLKGAAVGADMKVGEKSSLGVAFGYIDGDAKIPGMSKAEQEGTYVALYGEHGLKKLSATSCLSLDWVAAYGQTDTEWESADWEQESLQLNTRLNWNKKVTDRLCMSVFGGLEYFTSESDRVENAKTGSIQNLRGEIGVGARYVAWGTPGSEAVTDEKGATIAAARPGCEKLVLHGEIRYMNDLVRSNPIIEQDGLRGSGDNPGRQGMGIEAGATYRISERWSASANYGFNTMEDSKEHRVNVGASYTF